MIVIILNAGSGTRLGELTKNLPKGLLDINGKSLIERQIENFSSKNIEKILLIVGPNSDKFNLKNVDYVFDETYNEHEQLGSLFAAKKFMINDVIISFGDVLVEKNVFEQIIKSSFDIGLAIDLNWKQNYIGRSMHPESEADLVKIESDLITKIQKNLVKKDVEKIGEFLGIMKLNKNGAKIFVETYNKLQELHNEKFHTADSFNKAFLTDFIQELIDREIPINPILINGNWLEIDTSQDLDSAREKIKNWD
tara:strand:- start:120 stop:875 length:756 start_codon:yes stop_codon:yes gene_type:complete